MTESRFKVVAYRDVEASVFGDEAPGVTIRQLISGEADGAPVYNMRMIEIEPGRNTPDHDHPFEHENFIVSGNGEVMYEGAAYPVSAGDVVFLPPGARHQYRNTGEKPLVFLCGIPVSRGC